ncbi:MAG: ribosome biogenesis GTPase Der [Deltaproteobacteria bacterium]|nr:ribosome biogenesis GTPase Der [Deltaproteobacteria bacterium]
MPVVALVGRPNVGKSTLFNRLSGRKQAIVDNLPGVTRDRNYGRAEWYGKRFVLIDTGGFDPEPESDLEKKIQEQSRLALEEADVVLFLFDGKTGLSPVDRDAVELLRGVDKPVFFAVNKIDTKPREDSLYEFYALGLESLYPLSAEHGFGLSELMDSITAAFPAEVEERIEEEASRPLSLAVVGRPNVGKSTLVNRLLGYGRSVVDAGPGTTRDALESPFVFRGQEYVLVDTAGIRRKARIVDRIERYSVIRSLGSVDRGDVVIHLLDGSEGVTDQDAQILAYAAQRGKGLVLAVNKSDLISHDQGDRRSYRERVYEKLAFVDYAPVTFISALTGYGVDSIMQTVARVASAYQCRVQTSRLNQALQEAVQKHTPPLARGRQVKFFYATQTATRPPTFVIFVNFPMAVAAEYRRYLERQLRLNLGLENSPLRLIFRARREQRVKSFRGAAWKRSK